MEPDRNGPPHILWRQLALGENLLWWDERTTSRPGRAVVYFLAFSIVCLIASATVTFHGPPSSELIDFGLSYGYALALLGVFSIAFKSLVAIAVGGLGLFLLIACMALLVARPGRVICAITTQRIMHIAQASGRVTKAAAKGSRIKVSRDYLVVTPPFPTFASRFRFLPITYVNLSPQERAAALKADLKAGITI